MEKPTPPTPPEPENKPLELCELTLPQLWRLKDCMEHPEKYDIDPKHKGTPGQIAAVTEAIEKIKTRDSQLMKKVVIMQRTGKGLRRAKKPTKKQIEIRKRKADERKNSE